MKKKLLLCALILALALSLCACGSSTMADAEPITDTCTANGYAVQIVGAHLLYGANGDAQVAVELNYTNSNAEATSFMSVGQVRVFQNGVEQQTDGMVLGDGFAWDSYYTQIKDGASTSVFVAKPVSSETDPVEVNVEIINQNNGKIIAKAAATLEMVPASVIDYEVTYANCAVASTPLGDSMNVVVSVKNTGTEPIVLTNGNCDIQRSDGFLLENMNFPTFYLYAAPNETVYAGAIKNGGGSVSGELTVVPYFDVNPAASGSSVEVSNYNISFKEDNVSVSGTLTNTGDSRLREIAVVAVLFAGDTPDAVLATSIDGLSGNASTEFCANGFGLQNFVTANQLTDCKVFAYPLPF